METMSTMEKKFVLSFAITKVSSMSPGDQRMGPIEEHFNSPWFVVFKRNNEQLFVYLHCALQSNKAWSIKTRSVLKLGSLNGKWLPLPSAYTFGDSSEFRGFGESVRIDWDWFLKEFAAKDSIVVEAHVVIEEMSGIEEPQKKKNFDEAHKGLSDVVLKVDNEKFYVSKLTLATQSPVFQTLFFGGFKEAQQSEITLNDVEPEIFQRFLELLYLEPSLTDSNIEGVLQLTDMYGAKNGARLCEEYLINESKHSLKNKIRIGGMFKLEKLIDHCITNIKSSADMCSVIGDNVDQLDSSIAKQLLMKSLLL